MAGMSSVSRVSAVLLTTCVAVVGGGALPALAAPAVDYAGLDAIFDAPQSVNGVVQLDADLTQDLSDGDTTDRLDLAAGSTLTLDLNGYDLNTGSVVLGAGSQLTITDTSTGTPGTFTALPIDSNDPVFDQAAGRLAAIDTAEAALIIEGRARVHADSGLNGTPAIGGTGLVDSGTITIRAMPTSMPTASPASAAPGVCPRPTPR